MKVSELCIEKVLDKAFIDGEIIKGDYGTVTIKTRKIGEVVITSGSIIACDPLSFSDVEPFNVKVPKGSFPVVLSVGNTKNNKQIVAYAMVKFSEKPVVFWDAALFNSQNPFSLDGEEVFGYVVDAGTGCFMDEDTAKMLLPKLEDESYRDSLIAEINKQQVSAYDCAKIELNPKTDDNLLTFSTGYGDGIYGSYFGYDKQGKIVCLVTDFLH